MRRSGTGVTAEGRGWRLKKMVHGWTDEKRDRVWERDDESKRIEGI